MLRRRGPARASVLRAARANRANKRAPRGIDLEQMHRRPADRAAVGLRPHGSWSAAVARWNAGRLVCIPDRGSALPASGNSGGTAGELAPHPTRGHLPSVHDVLSAGLDQERGVEHATRGRPARAAPRYHRGRSGRVPWCGISPKPAPTQANSSSRRCWICISRRSYRYPPPNGAPCPAHAQHRMPPPVIRSQPQNPVPYDAFSVHLVRLGPTRPCLCHRWSTWWCRTPTMSGLTPTRVWPIGARRWVSVRRGVD